MGTGSWLGTSRCPAVAPWYVHGFRPKFVPLIPILAAIAWAPPTWMLWGQEVAHDSGRWLLPRSLEVFGPIVLLAQG